MPTHSPMQPFPCPPRRASLRTNKYRFPVGKRRMQSLGIIAFACMMGTMSLYVVLQAIIELIQQHKGSLSKVRQGWYTAGLHRPQLAFTVPCRDVVTVPMPRCWSAGVRRHSGVHVGRHRRQIHSLHRLSLAPGGLLIGALCHRPCCPRHPHGQPRPIQPAQDSSVQAYAQDHFNDVVTNSVSMAGSAVAAAVPSEPSH